MRKTKLLHGLSRQPATLVLIVVVVGAILADPGFFRPVNLFNLARQVAPPGIVAVGMTVVIIAGGIDLSVGATYALASVIAVWAQPAYGSVIGVAMALGAGLAAGLVNALLVTRLRINAFIGTLGVMTVLRGLALSLSHSHTLPGRDPGFARMADLPVLGVPLAAIVFLILLALVHVFLTLTPTGRLIYAVGGSRQASRIAGLPVDRALLIAYLAPGFMAAVAGVLVASEINSGSPVLGNDAPLYAIAAVLLGGVSMRGGAGSLIGALQGILILGILTNGLNIAGVGGYYQILIVGLLLVFTVVVDELLLRRRF